MAVHVKIFHDLRARVCRQQVQRRLALLS